MKKTEHNNFSARLRDIIDRSGLSDAEFARRISVGKSTLFGYLSGSSQPKQDTITLIVRDFSVNANWLLLGEGDPEAEQNAPPGQKQPDQEQPGVLPDAAVITRAVLDVESGMRRAGVREPVIWQAVKSMVDDKLAQLRQEQPDQSVFQEELESKALRTRTSRDINEGESDTPSRNGIVAER